MSQDILKVRIISPQELVLETDALSVSSKNSQGPFDILPQHANFLTVVDNQPIEIRDSNQKLLKYSFPLAIIFASENQVSIYTYIQPDFSKK